MAVRAHVSGNVAGPGSTQINNVSLNTTYTTDDLDRACLNALRCPNTFDVKTRLKEKDKLLYKSIEWVEQDPQYARWQNSKDVSLLWIKGGAGKGKTMMSIGLTERLEQYSHFHEHPPVVTYFFCQNTNYELNTIEGIIKGLVLCLVNQQKELCEPLRRRWDTDNRRFKEDLTSWRALWGIFLDMLHRCKSQRIYVVIDALDECQDRDMGAFLQLIVRTGYHSRVKWLLTSRPFDSAGRELLTASDQVMVSLELNSDHVAKAVKSYIAEKVAELNQRNNYELALCRQLEAELTRKAEDTYLWVSLVCKRLEKLDKAYVLATIQELPPGLTPFYHRIFTDLQKGESAVVDSSIRLFKVMLAVYRPLREEEVSSVTGLQVEGAAIKRLVDRCASFVKKRGARIEFVHQSARDYLAQEAQATLSLYENWAHGEIMLSCLEYLSQHLKVNLMNLPRPDSERKSLEGLQGTVGKSLLNSVDYAATFWVQHLADAGPTTLTGGAFGDQGKVIKFLHDKLLEWFECLSLLDQLPRTIKALKILTDTAQDSSLSAFLHDATRFLLRHHYTISMWPLQIYCSAIGLSPQTSIVRVKNLHKVPSWLRALPKTEATWAPLLQTLRGHSDHVKAVVFSPDGKQIASGSDDQAIKLWDAATGDCLKTLAHLGSVNDIAFSPDSKQIASGSDDQTIKLWDVATGDCMKTLAYPNWASAIVFSPDGKQIASGYHGTVKLWDATTGDCIKTLTHPNWANAIIFSPDGRQIASSYHGAVKLWDAATGDYIKTLKCPNWASAIVFSPDGKQIALACIDETIKLWDTTTGDWITTLTHSERVNAIAFSPDGKQIALGCNITVHLWDATTGDCIKTLKEHSGLVNAVAFSPDGKQIASSSDDKTIKLWDAAIEDVKTLGHLAFVNAIVFSPDGKQIASGSIDETIKLWDAATGNYIMTLKGHSDWVNAIAFSPDSKQIVSGSYDKIIKLWDAATGDCIKTLKEHSGLVNAVAFSPDGKQIASGSKDKTIKLWDAATGDCVKTLKGHSDWVNAIAFSPNGKHVASGSNDKTVKLWDVSKALRPSKFLGNRLNNRLNYRWMREIKTSEVVTYLRYSEDGSSIVTSDGVFTLSVIVSDAYSCSSTSLEELWVDDMWLCYGTMRLLRLVSDSEPVCLDTNGDRVAVGMSSGHVWVFDIDRRRLDRCNPEQLVCEA